MLKIDTLTNKSSKRVTFHTLGCKVNSYESEAMWQLFKKVGYERVDEDQTTDVFIINTCTVTNTGDKKSRQVIRRAIRKNPNAIIIATGCYAQIAGAELLDIPGLDIVVGTQDREKLLDMVEEFEKTRQPINAVRNIMKTKVFEELDVPSFTDRTRASLKIQEGCNNFCTFCIIPWARGLVRSRDPKEVVRQSQQLVDAGYKEIVLTGIHTGGYGLDFENYKLADLLRDLDKEVAGLRRIRISSIEASQISDDVIKVLKESDKVVRHLHVPIQSASDSVLKRMHRKYTTTEFAEKIEKLRIALPELAITSDVIVGFPGETEEEFMETYNFIKDQKFSELHVFPYSKRSGTPAAKYENQVNEEVKNERVQRLIALSNQLSKEYAEKFADQVLEVIPEERHKELNGVTMYEGYSDNYLRMIFPATEDMVGKIVKIKLIKPDYPYSEGQVVKVLE
jgi:threonylcarbamoyladenosine tRNA methylthiotransferase MtaB